MCVTEAERCYLKSVASRECKRARTALISLIDYAAINGHLLSRAENIVHAIDYFLTEATIEIANHKLQEK